MSHVRTLVATGAIVAAGALAVGAAAAMAAVPTPTTTSSGTDVNTNAQGDTGEHATANDLHTAANDLDDGQVGDIDSQDHQVGTTETGSANDLAEASGDANASDQNTNDPAGDSGPTGTSQDSGASSSN
jgi:hypothetical protein